jgi:L-alanine-DL-glutamate epimerase-like enolase superfamily enzyme
MNGLSIDSAASTFEIEPLSQPYGFKGGQTTRLWQILVKLQDTSGNKSIGLGVQNPLWSDATVSAKWSEKGGNEIMYKLTKEALRLIKGKTYESPVHMIDSILEDVHAYGIYLTQNKNLLKTFALNTLVAVDNAAWLLYAKQNKITSIDALIPVLYRAGLSYKNNKVASIPSISYSTSETELEGLARDGYFFLKIKIGAPGTQEEMLKKDMERMSFVHKKLGSLKTKNSESGKVLYYPDANGRYESKATFNKFLDHCKKIGAFEHIVVVEEPFVESYKENVSDIDVKLAADESAHTYKDALERIELGYAAIALKPIAKTLSMTLKIAKLAFERKIPCLCADLTVNPLLVDWNKNIAARLKPLPGMQVGSLETNGHQNYTNWLKLVDYHPKGNASWNTCTNGAFNLSDEFYNESGGIFYPSNYYAGLFKNT